MRDAWSLYNKEDKLRIDDLSLDQVKTILLAIASSRMGHWYACRADDVQWTLIAEVPEFYDHAQEQKGEALPVAVNSGHSAHPPAARRPLFEEMNIADESTLSVNEGFNADIKERRSARRYAKNLLFRWQHNEQQFECETSDVSMSGLALKQDLPAEVPQIFQAELSFAGHSVNVSCAKVSACKIKLRDTDAWNIIRAWLAHW